MGEQSGIEWTDATFNPWEGCTKISPACDNCYAATRAERFGTVKWGGPRRRTSASNWYNPRRWQKQADAFEAENGRPRFVFCASLADVFDNQVPVDWRADLWDLIRDCDRLVWLLLTKRPQNIAKMLPDDWGDGWKHVWLGTTVEDQKRADLNIPPLLRAPAAKRFLSMEPLVGPVDLEWIIDVQGGYGVCPLNGYHADRGNADEDGKAMFDGDTWQGPQIDWIITGGESGAYARPADPSWYRELCGTAQRYGVPFHFKQWGEYDAEQKRVGKKTAGRLLDGRTWDQRPEAA